MSARVFPPLALVAVLRRLVRRLRAGTDDTAVAWIEVPELMARLERAPRPVIIDVRGGDEFTGELGHIEGARNVTLADLPQRLDDLRAFMADEVVLVCKTQMRSAKAAELLMQAGFGRVAVLRGGMVEWVRQHRPVATAGSMPGGAA